MLPAGIKPYYQHNGIAIICGDCREILPELTCDVIVSDPPYGIGLENHAPGKERRAESYTLNGDDCREVGEFILEYASKREMPLVLFGSPWAPWPGKWRNLIVWDKGGAVGGGGDTGVCLRRTWELIQTARTYLWGTRDESVYRLTITPQDTELHIARKPPGLMEYLLRQFCHECDVIADPCCGSGSTIEAAKFLNRKAIGIEIEEKYCEIAAKRLSQEVFQW